MSLPIDIDLAIGNSVQMTVKEKYGTCVLCNGYYVSNLNIMGEHLCYECRDKFIQRIKLIMNFQ